MCSNNRVVVVPSFLLFVAAIGVAVNAHQSSGQGSGRSESQADFGVQVAFVDSGVTAKVGGYRPIHADLKDKSDLVKKAPEGLTAAKYGEIKIGDRRWALILDEPEGKPARLYVDTNGDGDLTNDPTTKWEATKQGDFTMFRGSARVDLGDGKIGELGMYRFDPKDPKRAQLKNTLLFYTDFGYEVSMTLDGKKFSSFVSGPLSADGTLSIDRNGDKHISSKRETLKIGTPFNFTGTTYVLKFNNGELALEKTDKALPTTPLPPELGLGKKALPFIAKTMDGKALDFPKGYAGKIVMLDFWATWCGPCIAELPNVKKAYEAWHDKGFEIIGISFDNMGMDDKLKNFLKEKGMSWPQIYEGKGWETALGELYDVSGIPFVLLVDGDSGEILGTTRELRGPGLSEFVAKALQKKKGTATRSSEPKR